MSVTADATRLDLYRAQADLNLAEFMRHLTRHGGQGSVVEEDGLLLVAGDHAQPGPYRNAALRTDGRLPAADVLHRAGEFFRARRRGHVLWARDHADADLAGVARGAGFDLVEAEGLPAMVLEDLDIEGPALPADARLTAVDDESGGWDFLRVVADAFTAPGLPPEVAASMFFSPTIVDEPHVAAFVAYVDDQAVSSAMVLTSHGVGGIYWVATTPRARRMGLAEACSRAAIRAGAGMGAAVSMLQHSPLAAGIYRRIGYTPLTRYHRFLVRPTVGWE